MSKKTKISVRTNFEEEGGSAFRRNKNSERTPTGYIPQYRRSCPALSIPSEQSFRRDERASFRLPIEPHPLSAPPGPSP